jgi:hypothetical protein
LPFIWSLNSHKKIITVAKNEICLANNSPFTSSAVDFQLLPQNRDKKKLAVKNRSSKRSRNLHNVNFSHVCDTLVVDPRNKLVFISDCVKTWFLLFHVKMKTRKTIPEKRILKKAKFGFRRQNYIPKNVNILWRSIEKHVIFEQKLFCLKIISSV